MAAHRLAHAHADLRIKSAFQQDVEQFLAQLAGVADDEGAAGQNCLDLINRPADLHDWRLIFDGSNKTLSLRLGQRFNAL